MDVANVRFQDGFKIITLTFLRVNLDSFDFLGTHLTYDFDLLNIIVILLMMNVHKSISFREKNSNFLKLAKNKILL